MFEQVRGWAEFVFIRSGGKLTGPFLAEFPGNDQVVLHDTDRNGFYWGHDHGYAANFDHVLYRAEHGSFRRYKIFPTGDVWSPKDTTTCSIIRDDENETDAHILTVDDLTFEDREIARVLTCMIQSVASSDATDEEKTEAVSVFKKFLRLPVTKKLFGDLTQSVYGDAPPREQRKPRRKYRRR